MEKQIRDLLRYRMLSCKRLEEAEMLRRSALGFGMFPFSLDVARGRPALCSGQVPFIRQHKQPWEPAGSLAEPVQTAGCKGTSSGADNGVLVVRGCRERKWELFKLFPSYALYGSFPPRHFQPKKQVFV